MWPNALVPRFQFPISNRQDGACGNATVDADLICPGNRHGTDETKPQLSASSTFSSQITEILMARLSGNYMRDRPPDRPAIVDENGSLKVPPASSEMANQTFGLVADVYQATGARCPTATSRSVVAQPRKRAVGGHRRGSEACNGSMGTQDLRMGWLRRCRRGGRQEFPATVSADRIKCMLNNLLGCLRHLFMCCRH